MPSLSWMKEAAELLTEAANRPGIMSLAGLKAENDCRKDVALYFKMLKVKVMGLHLERWTDRYPRKDEKEVGRHVAEMQVGQVVRRNTDYLQTVLRSNYEEAWQVAYKQTKIHEADSPVTVGPASGRLSQDAADYAAEQAAKQVVGINQTTVDAIADTVANAIELQMSPADLSRDLQDLLTGWTKDRADMVARTEMSAAFGDAAVSRLSDDGIEYMQLILSPGACPICEDIADDGPVRVSDGFAGGYDSSPIHPNCRCATVGSRPPAGE